MTKWLLVFAFIFAVFCAPSQSLAVNESLLAGYGFGILNQDGQKTESGYYNFFQIAFATERPMGWKNFTLLIEPFVAYIINPSEGVDGGISLGLRYYPMSDKYQGLYFTAGAGGAYTSVQFKEQGSHLVFILHGGIGYRWKNFFIEDRIRHYSNGGLSSPNRSINANIVNVGMVF